MDSSNFSPELTRNRVRQELLPLLRTFNPRCDEALARTAELLAEDERYLRAEVAGKLELVRDSDARLDLQALRAMAPSLRRHLLRGWLRQAAAPQPAWVHLAALEKLIVRGQSGQGVDLPGGWRVEREFDKLRYLNKAQRIPTWLATMPFVMDTLVEYGGFEFLGRRGLPLAEATKLMAQHQPGTAVLLRESSMLGSLWLRMYQPGDAYVPAGKQGLVKLKRLLMRQKIARTARATHPLLAAATGEIIWSPGLSVAAAYTPLIGDALCALVTARKR